jgi:hypothetical protein
VTTPTVAETRQLRLDLEPTGRDLTWLGLEFAQKVIELTRAGWKVRAVVLEVERDLGPS